MTPVQQQCAATIIRLNDSEFNSWYRPSELMAFAQIESSFRPKAYRFEPRLGEGSYGLMQVLASTALSYDKTLTNPEAMYDPVVGLRIGMTVARDYFEQLQRQISRDPTYEEWAVSYNAGVRSDVRHIGAGDEAFDAAYANQWDAAQTFWAGVFKEPT